jgi:uncharacterized protein YndB with AHSA1/START domain
MSATVQRDYAARLALGAPPARAFEALTTLEGLGGWWTPTVSGNPLAPGRVTFGFDGLDETIVMRVDEAVAARRVVWTCLRNDGHPEWIGTRIVFQLEDARDGDSVLLFRHEGLLPLLDCYDVCETGWDHFLVSLADYAATGSGSPFA